MNKNKNNKSIFRFIPLRRYILMESNPDFADNTKPLFDIFIEKGVNKKYKIIWFVYNKKEFKNVKIKNVKFVEMYTETFLKKTRRKYYENTAKIIIDGNKYIKKTRKNQFRFHLGHGMPLKKADKYCKGAGDFNFILQESSYFTDIMCKLYEIDKSKLVNLGYCRNDDLIRYKDKDIIKNEEWKNKKIIVWLPTYRKHRIKAANIDTGVNFLYGIPCLESKEQLRSINKLMKEYNILLLIKLHPAQDKSKLSKLNLSNLRFITDEMLKQSNITLYQLLAKSSALITDYSSVYYDYLLTEKPIGLAINDLENYIKKFGIIYENYYDAIKGEYIYNYKDLEHFIINIGTDNDEKYEERISAMNKYHNYKDDKSSLRVYEFLRPYLKL